MSDQKTGRKELGKCGAKHHQKVFCDNVQNISPSHLFIVLPAEIEWNMSGHPYEETHCVLKVFYDNVICDVVTYTEQIKCKTTTTMDMVYVPKRQCRTLWRLRNLTQWPNKNYTSYDLTKYRHIWWHLNEDTTLEMTMKWNWRERIQQLPNKRVVTRHLN